MVASGRPTSELNGRDVHKSCSSTRRRGLARLVTRKSLPDLSAYSCTGGTFFLRERTLNVQLLALLLRLYRLEGPYL